MENTKRPISFIEYYNKFIVSHQFNDEAKPTQDKSIAINPMYKHERNEILEKLADMCETYHRIKTRLPDPKENSICTTKRDMLAGLIEIGDIQLKRLQKIESSPDFLLPTSCSSDSQSFLDEYHKATQEMKQKIEQAERVDTRRRLIALEKQIAELKEMVKASMKRKRK
jgi:hypothetical protein